MFPWDNLSVTHQIRFTVEEGNQSLGNRFEFSEMIGEGGQGIVYKATRLYGPTGKRTNPTTLCAVSAQHCSLRRR